MMKIKNTNPKDKRLEEKELWVDQTTGQYWDPAVGAACSYRP
jgi:hypothetical protein